MFVCVCVWWVGVYVCVWKIYIFYKLFLGPAGPKGEAGKPDFVLLFIMDKSTQGMPKGFLMKIFLIQSNQDKYDVV